MRWLTSIAAAALLCGTAHAALIVPEARDPSCGPFGPSCPRAKKRLNLFRLLTDQGEVLDLVEMVGGQDIRDLAAAWARGEWRVDVGKRRVYVMVRGTLPEF